MCRKIIRMGEKKYRNGSEDYFFLPDGDKNRKSAGYSLNGYVFIPDFPGPPPIPIEFILTW
jgi:hypothetical protein